MPTATTKEIGICNEVRLDAVDADVDLSADITTFNPALLRVMLESNQIGFKVMDVVHGAFDFKVTMNLDNRKDSALHAIFAPYFQGLPPSLMSLTFLPDAALAVSATNQLWLFQDGKSGTIPGPNVEFNTVQQTTFEIVFSNVGISSVAGVTFTSIIDGTTTLTHIADDPPV